jgi:hypothetical protein
MLLILGSIVASFGILLDKSYLSSEISFVLFIFFAIFFYYSSNKITDSLNLNLNS